MFYLEQSYGIIIPEGTDTFQRVANGLKKLNSSSYYSEFLCDFVAFVNSNFSNLGVCVLENVLDIRFTDLNGVTNGLDSYNYLIMTVDHALPTLISSPFTSKRGCIKLYKEHFSHLLPQDFPYEDYIGTFSYIVDDSGAFMD